MAMLDAGYSREIIQLKKVIIPVENAIFCIQCVPINWRDKLMFKKKDILDKADRVKKKLPRQ